MANIRFIVGPLGGGQVEIGGEVASFLRNPGVVPPFIPPEKIENGVYYGWLTEFDSFNEIEEFKHAMATNHTFTPNAIIQKANDIMSANPSLTNFIFNLAGSAQFIDQIFDAFPDATYYFTKRTTAEDSISLMISHAREREVCSCGQSHGITVNDGAFQSYVEQLNQRIITAIDSKLAILNYQWTEGNLNVGAPNYDFGRPLDNAGGINREEKRVHTEVLFMSPAQVAVYKSSGDPLVYGFSEYHNMHSY